MGSWSTSKNKRRCPLKTLPTPLQALLEDDNLLFVGVGIKGDCTRLEKSFEVQINNAVDVSSFAVERKMELMGRSLSGICATFLKRSLSKAPQIRLSKWNDPLCPQQVDYACLDSYASILCYQHVIDNCDPIWHRPPEQLEVGNHVQLYVKGSSTPVAYGTIVDNEGRLTWGKTNIRLKTRSGVSRTIVNISEVKASGAMCPHRDQDGSAPKALSHLEGKNVLWDQHLLRHTKSTTPDPVLIVDALPDVMTSYSAEDEFFCIKDAPTDDPMDVDIPTPDSLSDRNIYVRLDAYHGMTRLSKTLKKGHGAFRSFMARFRDAMFLVNTHDLHTVQDALRKQGMSHHDIQKKMEVDWIFFLKYCRRVIPPPPTLLQRFDRLCHAFQDVQDSKTKEPLFRSHTQKAVQNLRGHIEKGCISDVTGIPLYVAAGKDPETGLTTYRSIRGTNGTEGYHRHMLEILSRYCASPRLLHELLMMFNYRWNINMAVKNRGLSKTVGGFYDQHLIEQVNDMSSHYTSTVPYPEWVSIQDFTDTGERTGFQVSDFQGHGPIYSVDDLDLAGLSEGDPTAIVVNEPIYHPDLTSSARYFAKLQGQSIPTMAISTQAERDKFFNEYPKYLSANSGTSQRSLQQGIDFDQWALDWNATIDDDTFTESPSIRRKTASHLAAFHRQWKEESNARETMRGATQGNSSLRRDFRKPTSAFDFPSVETWTFPSPTRKQDDNLKASVSSETPPETASSNPRQSKSATTPPKTGSVEKRSGEDSSTTDATTDATTRPKALPMCQRCGHVRTRGFYKKLHPGRSGCNVSVQDIRRKCECAELIAGRKRGPHHHPCDCFKCHEILEEHKKQYPETLPCPQVPNQNPKSLPKVVAPLHTHVQPSPLEDITNLGIVPRYMRPFIKELIDVPRDGNCGYHCVSRAVYAKGQLRLIPGEEQVRIDLREELLRNKMLYEQILSAADVSDLIGRVTGKGGPRDKWMVMGDFGWVIANAYNRPVVLLSLGGFSETFLPLTTPPPKQGFEPICFAYHSEHFYAVSLKENHVVPKVSDRWQIHATESALEWAGSIEVRVLEEDTTIPCFDITSGE